MATLARADWSAAILVGVLTVAGCATTPADRLRLSTEANRPATDLAGLAIDPARDYVVGTTNGLVSRGRVKTSVGALILAEPARQPRVVPETEIVFVGVVTGASRMRRGWIGAAVGAIVGLPFGISIKGDMVVPAAILGAQVARRTGDEHVEVLLDRRQREPGSGRSTAKTAAPQETPANQRLQPTARGGMLSAPRLNRGR